MEQSSNVVRFQNDAFQNFARMFLQRDEIPFIEKQVFKPQQIFTEDSLPP